MNELPARISSLKPYGVLAVALRRGPVPWTNDVDWSEPGQHGAGAREQFGQAPFSRGLGIPVVEGRITLAQREVFCHVSLSLRERWVVNRHAAGVDKAAHLMGQSRLCHVAHAIQVNVVPLFRRHSCRPQHDAGRMHDHVVSGHCRRQVGRPDVHLHEPHLSRQPASWRRPSEPGNAFNLWHLNNPLGQEASEVTTRTSEKNTHLHNTLLCALPAVCRVPGASGFCVAWRARNMPACQCRLRFSAAAARRKKSFTPIRAVIQPPSLGDKTERARTGRSG